jgi:hypothetical protein
MRADTIYGMSHIYTEYAQMDYYGRVFPQQKGSRLLRNVMHHHMEDIMVHFAHKQRFGRVDFIGLPCMKTPKISSEGIRTARSMEESQPAMPCH